MAQNIILKRSSLPGKVPDTVSLNVGELAINTYDGKLFIKRSGSAESIQSVLTTDSITTGSITLTQTASVSELIVSQDANVQRDLYVIRDIITNRDIDAGGDISGSGLQVNNTLNIIHGQFSLSASTSVTGSVGIDGDLTVLGAVNARQFNINVISSSIIYQSGSTKFGDTIDDTHQFTGSVDVSGSFLVNGNQVGLVQGPNTFDFNLDPSPAGYVNYITDDTQNTQLITRTNSAALLIGGTTYVSMSVDTFNITTGSITANYMHLAKYISTAGDLDFNI